MRESIVLRELSTMTSRTRPPPSTPQRRSASVKCSALAPLGSASVMVGQRSTEPTEARHGEEQPCKAESVFGDVASIVRVTLENGRRADIGPWLKSAMYGRRPRCKRNLTFP